MSIVENKRSISPTLSNLIAEANFSIESVKEKILAAYNYAINTDGYEPIEAAKLLRENLTFSKRYIREVLPLEAKDEKKKNLYIKHDAEPAPHTSTDATTTTTTVSALEEFRRQKGKQVAPEEEETTITTEAETTEEEEVIYDQPEKIIKQYEEKIAYLAKPFTRHISFEYKTQILAVIITVDPDTKEVSIDWDTEEMKKLRT